MSYLSKRGYVIRKNNINNDEANKLKLELRAKPLVDDKYNKENQAYPVYI